MDTRELLPARFTVAPFSLPVVSIFRPSCPPIGYGDGGRPVLLDLQAPGLAPILVTAGRRSGKTHLLRLLAHLCEDPQGAGDMVFQVITERLDEWDQEETLPSCQGIWPLGHPSVDRVFRDLTARAQERTRRRPYTLLLIDGLAECLSARPEIQPALRQILAKGSRAGVLTAAASPTHRLADLIGWLPAFPLRLQGFSRLGMEPGKPCRTGLLPARKVNRYAFEAPGCRQFFRPADLPQEGKPL